MLALIVLFALLIAVSAGALVARRRDAVELTRLRAALAEASLCEVRLAEQTRQMSVLRHDLRGILSPAMLVADRLLDNPDPGVKRAGEMVIRTVERLTARLAENAPGQAAGAPPTT